MRYRHIQDTLTTWTIVPTNTPLVIRNCSKCGIKKEFYCSEKFRMNGRHTKIDIWLIYKVDGFDANDLKTPLHVQIKSPYLFELKLGTLLAGVLGISTSRLKKLVDSEAIQTSPSCNVMKHRIRADLEVFFN